MSATEIPEILAADPMVRGVNLESFSLASKLRAEMLW